MLAPTVSIRTQWAPSCQWAAVWSYLAMKEDDERLHERIMEQTTEVPVPQIFEEIVDSVQAIPRVVPQERTWCIFEAEEYREVVKVTPPELRSGRIVEKIDDLTVPRFVKENLVFKAVPQECVAERTEVIKPITFSKDNRLSNTISPTNKTAGRLDKGRP